MKPKLKLETNEITDDIRMWRARMQKKIIKFFSI